MSSGPRASLPRVPGDGTSQSAVSPGAITDNPGSVSISTGSGFSAVSPSSAGNHQGMHHLRVDAVSNRPGRRTGNSPNYY